MPAGSKNRKTRTAGCRPYENRVFWMESASNKPLPSACFIPTDGRGFNITLAFPPKGETG